MAEQADPVHDRILALVEDSGNRAVLEEWLAGQERYEVVPTSVDVATAGYDCCIADLQQLVAHREDLLVRTSRNRITLPCLLLVEAAHADHVRARLREEYPELWDLVDGVIEMPLEERRFADRLESLLRIRRQSVALLQQQEQLRAIRDEHAGHGVLITDVDGTIEYANPALLTQSGYSRRELIGENPSLLKSGVHDEAFYEDLWETILAGEVWHGVVENERKDGTRYVLDQTIAPVRGPDGAIDGFLAVNHEITELKEMEARLRSQREELEILNRVMRHDIRNDMTVILGWARALDDEVGPPGREYLDRLLTAGEHVVELTHVTGDLVETIIEGGDPEIEAVDLGDLLAEEVQKRRATFDEATIEMPERPPAATSVWGNELLSSVFRNLINNAVQHNDADEPRVTITTETDAETVTVRVADNGPGIPDDRKPDVFGEGSQGLESEGTGMGLYLVSLLVQSYDGTVRVRDNEPRGAVFSVTLPRAEGATPEASREAT